MPRLWPLEEWRILLTRDMEQNERDTTSVEMKTRRVIQTSTVVSIYLRACCIMRAESS